MRRMRASERTARFVIDRLQLRAGRTWLQGDRRPSLPFHPSDPSVGVVARKRLLKVKEAHALALSAWSVGLTSAEIRDSLFTVDEIIRLQAEGRRVVSLLPDSGESDEPLEVVLHDLKHMYKFFAPEHHRAQVGYFRLVARAHDKTQELALFDAELDDTWRSQRDYAVADMNGSPLFLFGYLKMRLKMAVRRKLARDVGRRAPTGGQLRSDELKAYARFLERLLDLLELRGEPREAARRLTARGGNGPAANDFLCYLDSLTG